MIRRMLCLLCAALLLCTASTASAAKKTPVVDYYDFDLAFSLNPEAFPLLSRERTSAYAEMLGNLGLKGRGALNPDTLSLDLDASLYYIDKPSLSYPFHLYWTDSRVFLTSPLLDNEELFFDMSGLMEFCVKAKSTLEMPVTWIPFLYPYVTENSFKVLIKSWKNIIGPSRKTGIVTLEQFEELSAQWAEAMWSNSKLKRWIFALMDLSDTPGIIETEFDNLPRYYEIVTGGEPLTVSAGKHSEIWQDAAGNTLFSKQSGKDSFSLKLSLPASENGYAPKVSVRTGSNGETSNFGISASITLAETQAAASSDEYGEDSGPWTDDGEGWEEYDEEVVEEVVEEAVEEVVEEPLESYDDYDGIGGEYGEYGASSSKPAELLNFRAVGSGFPRSLPADSVFTVITSVTGTAYPNYAFFLQGSTTKDGAVTVSLCKPGNEETAPVEIFRLFGTLTPAGSKEMPDHTKKAIGNAYNMFAMNDQSLSAFSKKMIPVVVKSLLSFVAAAPTSACQALLDDLTELGVLGMLLN